MHSNDGRYIIIYNGEIYNYKYLKKDTLFKDTKNWKSASDTEVVT